MRNLHDSENLDNPLIQIFGILLSEPIYRTVVIFSMLTGQILIEFIQI